MLSASEIINGLVGTIIENLLAKYGDRFPEPARRLLNKLGFVPDEFKDELRTVLTSSLSRLFNDYPVLVNYNLSETVVLPVLTQAVDTSLYEGESPDFNQLRLEFARVREYEWELTTLERTRELDLDAMLRRFLEYLDQSIMDAAKMSDRAVMITVSNRIARTESVLSAQMETIISLLNHALADKQITRVQKQPFMVRELPPGLIHLEVENEIFNHLVDSENLIPSGNTVVVWGPGGSGKSTLAEAVCHREGVKEAFSDGVLWVTVGTADSEGAALDTITIALRKLYETITDKRPDFIDVEQAEKSVAALVRGKKYLVILDDVWDIPHVEKLIVAVQSCTRIITTRIAAIAEMAHGTRVEIDNQRLTSDEATQILSWGLNADSATKNTLAGLSRHLGKLPLLLGLVNNAIRRRSSFTGSTKDAVETIEQTLRRYGPVNFTPGGTTEYSITVAASIELSLEHLPQNTRNRFLELRIFPKYSEIPRSVVEGLWLSSARLGEIDATEMIYDLWNAALVKYDHKTKTIKIHDVIQYYLDKKFISLWGENAFDVDLTSDMDLHRSLLKVYENNDWRDVIWEEHYFARFLEYHLLMAFRDAELITLYKDLEYLARKTWIVQADSVEWRLKQLIHRDDKSDPVLLELEKAYRQSSHLLYYCKDIKDLRNTLYSRLAHNSLLSELISEFESHLEKPFLVPIRRIPDLPNPAQIRLIPLWAGLGTRDLLSKNGKVVATYGRERLIVHNIETLRIIFEYKGNIDCCTLNEDGTRVLLFESSTMWMVWDVPSKTKIAEHTCRDMLSIPRFCAMNGDGSKVVFTNVESTFEDNDKWHLSPQLNIWDIVSDSVESFETSREFTDLDISTNGDVIVSSHKDGKLRIWHVDNLASPLVMDARSSFCRISSTGVVVATTSEWGWKVILWNAATGSEIGAFELSERLGQVGDIAISGDGSRLALVANDISDGSYYFKVWDIPAFAERLSVKGTEHSHAPWTCSMSADGQIIVTSTMSGTKIWNGEESYNSAASQYSMGGISTCVMSADGNTLLSAFKEGTLVKWDVAGTQELKTFNYSDVEDTRGTEIWQCSINSTGTIAVVSGFHTYKGLLKVIDLEDGEVLATFNSHSSIRRCSIDSAGNRLCFGGLNSPLRIYDLRQQKEYSPPKFKAELGVCKVSPEGKRLIMGFWDGTIGVYDFETSEQIWLIKGHSDSGPVTSCIISSDGMTLVSQSGFTSAHDIVVWDLHNGQERCRLSVDQSYHGCALNYNGTLGIFTFSQSISIWDLVDAKCLTTIHVDGSVGDCACSPDLSRIVVAGDHGLYWLQWMRA